MYGEFIFPYYRKVASTYGLLSYGCCEPVNPVWDYVKQLGNLRKVSCSPWCDEAFMAEQLRGTKTIFHRKPSPNFLGVGETLDEEGFRQHIRHTLTTAAGCHLEITQRDVYTINNDIAQGPAVCSHYPRGKSKTTGSRNSFAFTHLYKTTKSRPFPFRARFCVF